MRFTAYFALLFSLILSFSPVFTLWAYSPNYEVPPEFKNYRPPDYQVPGEFQNYQPPQYQTPERFKQYKAPQFQAPNQISNGGQN